MVFIGLGLSEILAWSYGEKERELGRVLELKSTLLTWLMIKQRVTLLTQTELLIMCSF